MPDPQVLEIHRHGWEALDRLDYYVTGGTGALCVFVAERLSPAQLAWSPDTLELGSLLLLCASVAAGFKRLQNSAHVTRMNAQLMHLVQERDKLIKIVGEGGMAINPQQGAVLGPDMARVALDHERTQVKKAKEYIDGTSTWGVRWYTARNVLLALGFAGLVLSKVLRAYL